MFIFDDNGREIAIEDPSNYPAPASRIIPLIKCIDEDSKEQNEFFDAQSCSFPTNG